MSCNICGSYDHQETTAGCPDQKPWRRQSTAISHAGLALLAAARAEEREACAKIAKRWGCDLVAAAIRARGSVGP